MRSAPAIHWSQEIQHVLSENHGFINICYQAVDRHLLTPVKDHVAIRFVDKSWPASSNALKELSYQDLFQQTICFANILKDLGIKKGDVLFSLTPRIPELYVAALGTLRSGVIFSPLFSAFGPDPIYTRMKKGKGKILLTLSSEYRKKIKPIRDRLNDLKFILLIDDDGNLQEEKDVFDFHKLMDQASSTFILEKTAPDDPALLHFTSGTTGEPKGALHVHSAVVFHEYSGRIALDLRKDDVFWCTADPGWVTGTSYGIISPLCNGVTMLIDGADFNAERWYLILNRLQVTCWYTAPTAIRMLMRSGEELPKPFDFSCVRFAASVGEPLNPEIIYWVKKHLKIDLHDNWWQTETGGILIANDSRLSVRPGSMGKPIPGIEVALVKSHDSQQIVFVEHEGEQGEIAIRKGWPSMFVAYLDNPQRYQKCFVDDWYLSGDIAKCDREGYYWFVGRADDVIKTSGHLVGPFEVESILMEHPLVLEAGVIGIPDPMAGELIKGFVVLKQGHTPSEELRSEILAFSRKRLGVAVSPREIAFIDNLPKTRSGKIMRRLLKARQLGLPEGDLSTLEVTP